MQLFHTIEMYGDVIHQIHTFKSAEESRKMFLELINENIHPITLSNDSEKHFLNKEIYHNESNRYCVQLSKNHLD